MKPNLVALHGFLGAPSFWTALKEPLEPDFCIYTPDLYKDPEFKNSSWEVWPQQLLDWLQARGLSAPIVLIGYSMGGRLALDFAFHKPNWVSHLTLVSTRGGRPEGEEYKARKHWEENWLARFRSEDFCDWQNDWQGQEVFAGDSRLRIREDLSREEIASSFEAWSLSSQGRVWSDLKRLTCPTLWVFGDRDQKYKAFQALTASHHPQSQIKSLSEAGHRIPLDQPKRLGEHIEDFIFQRRPL